MTRFLWPGITFLSALWIWALPVYSSESSGWAYLLGFGLLLNVLGCLREKQPCIWWGIYFFSIPFLLGALLLSFPYNIPFILLLLWLATGLWQRRFRWIGPVSRGMLVSGLCMLPQALITPIYTTLAARYHEAGFLNPFFCWIFKAAGLPAALSQNTIYLSTPGEVFPVLTTWEKLGLYFCLAFFLAGLVVVFLSPAGKRVRSIIVLTLAVLCYAVVRYVFLTAVFIDSGKSEIFWESVWILVSFLPLALLLVWFLPPVWRAFQLQSVRPHIKHLALAVLGFIFIFSLAGAFILQDPGIPKKGRILIDELHSNWEWTTRKYNTSWYGIESGYNYYCLADYWNHFYQVESKFESLTPEVLSEYDILVVKMPTTPYSESEIEAIERFVKQGGGLFLIGDHTNVFGTSTNLNLLAQRFGLKFNHDSTYDLRTSDLSLYYPPEMLPHAAVQRMPYFLFATSCTLDAPLFSESVISGYNLKALDLDYSRSGFLPQKEEVKDYKFGLFLQAAAVKHGQGRVMAFTDSTCFSNFYMFISGKPELALGMMDWLNRKNSPVDYRCIFLVAAVLSLVLAGCLAFRWRKEQVIYILLFFILLGGVLSPQVYGCLNRVFYPTPTPHTGFVNVSFESEHSRFLLPEQRLISNSKEDFHTFYVWTQRLGYVPIDSPALLQALEKGDIVVLINPGKDFSQKQIDEVVRYVEKGGKILLLEDISGGLSDIESPANNLLSKFGMQVNYFIRKNQTVYSAENQPVGVISDSLTVEGGQPILVFDDGAAMLAMAEKGQGMIAAMASSSSFCNLSMGTTGTVPDAHRRFLYRLEFWLFESMVDGLFEPFVYSAGN
ncbi:MAG: hypothetical protein JXA46_03820 [Dehalococcoidales bacterium]|nr:hypothetical protein [Dehalococcoidales bacterium]